MERAKSNFSKFMLLWTGELISAIGGGLTSFGLGVYVFQHTKSAAGMALVTLLGFLPTLILSIPAGVLADRYDRRILMMLGDGCSALGILYILWAMLKGDAALYQICIGVCISAIFSALLEPAYRATITELLTSEEYARASGLVSLAGSSRYLVSPILAGLLLTISDIKLLLIIDISTFFVTVTTTAVVRKNLSAKEKENKGSFYANLKEGWAAVHSRQGVLILIMVSAVLTLFMGVFQILAEPLILAFTSPKTLGIAETICASGMLFSSILLGIKGIQKGYVKILTGSLILAGFGMVGFGLIENIYFICFSGFIFFIMLPFANSCLDYLVRTNIPAKLQGRAWGLIGFLSQIGYVLAYAISGVLADELGHSMGMGVGRGAAWVIKASGIMLVGVALMLPAIKSISALEKNQV